MKMKKNGATVAVGLNAVAEVAPALPLKKKSLPLLHAEYVAKAQALSSLQR